MEWFRSWHGAPTDIKWMGVAQLANKLLKCETDETVSNVSVTPLHVSGISWALLDYASQHDERGSIDGFDVSSYALWAGIPAAVIIAVVNALADKKVIEGNGFKNWAKRQPQDEKSTERVRRYRERRQNETDETVGNVSKPFRNARTEQIRTDKNIPPISPKRVDVGFELFWESWKPFEMAKGNKSQANKSYEKSLASGISAETLGSVAKQYCADCRERRCKTQHVATWLNQRGWETPPEPRIPFYQQPMNRMPSPAGG